MNTLKAPNPWVTRLQEQVQAALPSGRKTVVFEMIFAELITRYRTEADHPDTPHQIREAMDELLHSGRWRAVPGNRQHWLKGWRGLALPRSLVQQEPGGSQRPPVAWHSFLAERITGELSATVENRLLPLNEYLMARSRAGLPLFEGTLGHRERALQVFGDEKALESMPAGGWQNVNLTLNDLHCIRKAPPIPYEAEDNASGPALVVENSDTYFTLCHLNRRTLRWRAVIYGSGNLATGQAEGIAALVSGWGMAQVLYCGDLDLVGLHIADRLRTRLERFGIRLSLDESLYLAMIKIGQEGDAGKANQAVWNRDFDYHASWIPKPVRQAMDDLISRNKRIAQESLALTSPVTAGGVLKKTAPP